MYKDWDISPEEISAAYQSKCALEKTLRADIKDYRQIIYDLSGGKEKGMQAIEDWYDKEIAKEDSVKVENENGTITDIVLLAD